MLCINRDFMIEFCLWSPYFDCIKATLVSDQANLSSDIIGLLFLSDRNMLRIKGETGQ